jgi:hypothetical protein
VHNVSIIGPIAVTTEYWEESQLDGIREAGCRVQLRRVRDRQPPIPPAVPRRDAVFWSIEEPIWRADLFTTVGGPGILDAAHFHATFAGLVPSDRVLDPAIQADPLKWIQRRLSDLPGMLVEAGHPELVDAVDPDTLETAMPAILSAIQSILGYRPTTPGAAA